ncbi:hypothetical protein ONA70_16465 [Micromonospora yasonensis]|uniref:hypothetical protein n=1 Tax=Micromonospora yasonensis TaxID=1128667 RepID=UPI002230AD48|nr:hypothetical protein [Micromonospora yasonensis]MCW3841695.1 hypothetical protein [Micromonospora yasonensis]
MTQPMHTEPEVLAGAAQAIAGVAVELETGLGALEATVTSENPWGADEPGSVFGAAYTEVLSHALETYGSHVQLLISAAEGLADWAQQVVETDLESDQLFTKLHGRLGA